MTPISAHHARKDVERRNSSSIQQQPLGRIVKRFRGGLALKAHSLLYHSTLGSRAITKKKKKLQCKQAINSFSRRAVNTAERHALLNPRPRLLHSRAKNIQSLNPKPKTDICTHARKSFRAETQSPKPTLALTRECTCRFWVLGHSELKL